MFGSIFSPPRSSGHRFSSVIASVWAALAYDLELDESHITVTMNNGSLVLAGNVPSTTAQRTALRVARDLATCPVRDELFVRSIN